MLLLAAIAACGDSKAAPQDAATTSDAPVDAPATPVDATSLVGTLFVNEVMASNGSACPDPFGNYGDWAELYNAGDTAIDLTGYTVTDDTSMPAKATLGSGVTVPAHGYELIWCDDKPDLGANHVGFKLSASGEKFAIYSPSGEQIDAVTFGALATDVSYAREPDGTGAFVQCAVGTCGASNGDSCTAPVATGGLFVNEVMPSNTASCTDEDGVATSDWFEIYNAGTAAVSLEGYSVTDDLSMPQKVVLGSGLSVPAGGVLLFFADSTTGGSDGTRPNHVDFSLSKGGESVALFDPDGVIVDSFTWTSAAGDDVAYSRLPDGSGAFATCMTGTCGRLNGSACPTGSD